jgi:hypothetical protein
MFSPALFYDYYSTNGFKILKSYLFEYDQDHAGKKWNIYQYKPGDIDHLSFGGWKNGKLLGIFFVAQKVENSTCENIPQQGSYVKAWANHNILERSSELVTDDSEKLLKNRIKKLLKSNKLMFGLASLLIKIFRGIFPRKLKIIRKY